MNNTMNFSDLKNFINDNNNNNKLKKKKRKKIYTILLNTLTILLLVGGGIGVKVIMDYKEDFNNSNNTMNELLELSSSIKEDKPNEENTTELVETVDKEITELFKNLKQKNNETVLWLKVLGTDIDMPIVQHNDNKYYLSHNFDNRWNSMGWAFADYRNSFPDLSQNTIIYGHTYKRTTIFSKLQNVLEKSWLNNEDYHTIEVTTENKKLFFKVFSIYTIKETNDYLKVNFSYNEYTDFIDKITKRSIKDFNEELNYNDKILTLSTCYKTSNYRLVVHAKLIGEEVAYEKR